MSRGITTVSVSSRYWYDNRYQVDIGMIIDIKQIHIGMIVDIIDIGMINRYQVDIGA